jgi:hypothetical protein
MRGMPKGRVNILSDLEQDGQAQTDSRIRVAQMAHDVPVGIGIAQQIHSL